MSIQVNALFFSYPRSEGLFTDFSFEVKQGESWAVLGPSGCGKTTLLYLLSGLIKPAAGEVRIEGELVTRPRPRTGLILQEYGLLPWETVRENISLGSRIRKFYGPDGVHVPRNDRAPAHHQQVDYWLERLGLEKIADSYPSQISGGQRQRAAIARTLLLSPDVLLMDEPFASLDAPTREDLQLLVHQIQQENHLTVLVVTHAIETALFMGRQILLLQEPPNEITRVISNPSVGQQEGLTDPTTVALHQQLRQMLGEEA